MSKRRNFSCLLTLLFLSPLFAGAEGRVYSCSNSITYAQSANTMRNLSLSYSPGKSSVLSYFEGNTLKTMAIDNVGRQFSRTLGDLGSYPRTSESVLVPNRSQTSSATYEVNEFTTLYRGTSTRLFSLQYGDAGQLTFSNPVWDISPSPGNGQGAGAGFAVRDPNNVLKAFVSPAYGAAAGQGARFVSSLKVCTDPYRDAASKVLTCTTLLDLPVNLPTLPTDPIHHYGTVKGYVNSAGELVFVLLVRTPNDRFQFFRLILNAQGRLAQRDAPIDVGGGANSFPTLYSPSWQLSPAGIATIIFAGETVEIDMNQSVPRSKVIFGPKAFTNRGLQGSGLETYMVSQVENFGQRAIGFTKRTPGEYLQALYIVDNAGDEGIVTHGSSFDANSGTSLLGEVDLLSVSSQGLVVAYTLLDPNNKLTPNKLNLSFCKKVGFREDYIASPLNNLTGKMNTPGPSTGHFYLYSRQMEMPEGYFHAALEYQQYTLPAEKLQGPDEGLSTRALHVISSIPNQTFSLAGSISNPARMIFDKKSRAAGRARS